MHDNADYGKLKGTITITVPGIQVSGCLSRRDAQALMRKVRNDMDAAVRDYLLVGPRSKAVVTTFTEDGPSQ